MQTGRTTIEISRLGRGVVWKISKIFRGMLSRSESAEVPRTDAYISLIACRTSIGRKEALPWHRNRGDRDVERIWFERSGCEDTRH